MNYKLAEDEVVLYKGNITTQENNSFQLLLTNNHIVFTNNNTDLGHEIEPEVYEAFDIKVYKGVPQLHTKGTTVELYLKTTEKEFTFDSKNEMHKFCKVATELITGKTTIERGAEKVKKSIELFNDTFNTDIVKNTGDIIKSRLGGSKLSLPIKKNKK